MSEKLNKAVVALINHGLTKYGAAGGLGLLIGVFGFNPDTAKDIYDFLVVNEDHEQRILELEEQSEEILKMIKEIEGRRF